MKSNNINNGIGFILIFILLLYSCNENKLKKSPKIETKKNIVWIGQHVYLPESIIVLSPNSVETTKRNTNYTIISYYDADCSMCYAQLMKWIKTMESFKVYNVAFKFILSCHNSTLLKANLENIKFPLEISYYDNKNEFSEKYHFLSDPNYFNSSMLVDSKNTIFNYW